MHQNDAEMRAYLPGVGEKTQDFGGKGGSGDIEILWFAAQQQIAHAAARPATRSSLFERNCLTIDPARLSFVTFLTPPC